MLTPLANTIQANNDWLTTTLFESPGLAMAGIAFVWAILRVGGRRSGNAKILRLSWLALLLILGLLATSTLVTTKREAVSQAMDDLLLAVEYKDMPTFRELVLPDAMTYVLGKSHPRDRIELMIDKSTIDDLKATSSSMMIKPDSAMLMAIIRADGETAGMPGIQISRWRIEWKYIQGQWRVSQMTCEEMGPGALDW